jgi:hypothetical protein
MSQFSPRILYVIFGLMLLMPNSSRQTFPASGSKSASVIRGKNPLNEIKIESIVDQIIDMANSQRGVKELSSGPRNRGKEVDEYNKTAGGKEGDEWCAAFVSWVMGKVDGQNENSNLHKLKNLPQPPDFEKVAKGMGVLREPKKYSPRKGDLLIFKWPNSEDYHIEIVTAKPTVDGIVHTIGGNTYYDDVNVQVIGENQRVI